MFCLFLWEIKISSINTTTNLSKCYWKTLFSRFMNTIREYVSPNKITQNSKWSYGLWNSILDMSFSKLNKTPNEDQSSKILLPFLICPVSDQSSEVSAYSLLLICSTPYNRCTSSCWHPSFRERIQVLPMGICSTK